MSARAERSKNRRIRVVGGGFRWARASNDGDSGSSAKAMRRAMRKQLKDRDMTPEKRRAIKALIRESLIRKNG
jgi:hypothetical protein